MSFAVLALITARRTLVTARDGDQLRLPRVDADSAASWAHAAAAAVHTRFGMQVAGLHIAVPGPPPLLAGRVFGVLRAGAAAVAVPLTDAGLADLAADDRALLATAGEDLLVALAGLRATRV